MSGQLLLVRIEVDLVRVGFAQMWIPQRWVMALRSVDLPVPFSPTKKVTAESNSSLLVVWRVGRLNGYLSRAGKRSEQIVTVLRCMAARIFAASGGKRKR